MRYSEQFMEHIEYVFNAFCKIVLRDEAIGRLYGRCRSSINRRRNVALKQLRKEWEKLKHEE